MSRSEWARPGAVATASDDALTPPRGPSFSCDEYPRLTLHLEGASSTLSGILLGTMSEQHPAELKNLGADLERVTKDAKELMVRLSADLCEQTRLRETHLLDDPTDKRHERTREDSSTRSRPSVER